MKIIISRKETSSLPTKYGEFRVVAYECNSLHHIALVKGKIYPGKDILVRVHSECLTGDVFSSIRCDCREQLERSLEIIGKKGGVVLYLRQEGRGIGLLNKIKAYSLQDRGMDTVEANKKLGFKADARDYTIGVQILADLGVKKMKLMTNNPKKIEGLERYGIRIVERIPLIIRPNTKNKRYLRAKKEKLGHYLEDKGVAG